MTRRRKVTRSIELTAPIFFASDAHVTLARDPVTRGWSIVKWFTHRIT